MRNIQLSTTGVPLAILAAYFNEGSAIANKGIFFAFDYFTLYLISLQAIGGLLVSYVIKLADNIQKGFACSLAIVFTFLASMVLFNFNMTYQFFAGSLFVVCSVILYNYNPSSLQTYSNNSI